MYMFMYVSRMNAYIDYSRRIISCFMWVEKGEIMSFRGFKTL